MAAAGSVTATAYGAEFVVGQVGIIHGLGLNEGHEELDRWAPRFQRNNRTIENVCGA
jgi:hypothetical protein